MSAMDWEPVILTQYNAIRAAYEAPTLERRPV